MEAIKTREQFIGLLKEAWPELVRTHPQLLIEALGGNREQIAEQFRQLGFFVSPDTTDPRAVLQVNRNAIEEGRILTGFGARAREQCRSFARTYKDPLTGLERINFLWGEQEELANQWFRAFFSTERRDPVTKKFVQDIAEEMNKKVARAPATPLTGEVGTSGGHLVPTLVAAQIFQVEQEAFVLRNLVEVFVSAAPLRIPRRTSLVTIQTGGPATDLSEADPNILGSVTLSPNRVGAFAYIEPQLALASAVGPVAYFTRQFGEALAKWSQDVIVAGQEVNREPRGINTLPTSGGQTFDRAKTATWDNTSNATRRRSFRKLFYALGQPDRGTMRTVWITNNDGVQVMADTNDQDQRPFDDGPAGGLPTYMRRNVVESSAIVTGSNQTTTLLANMGQYAWQESPSGMELETTREGGDAWKSHTIGVKVVQHVDGAPVTPPSFGKMAAIDI